MEQKMFCYQCQETADCKGCTACGVCGKQPEVAAMQDLLVYVTKGLSALTTQLRAEGQAVDKAVKDIEDALKDLLGGTIQEMLESEMDEHLGYQDGIVKKCAVRKYPKSWIGRYQAA